MNNNNRIIYNTLVKYSELLLSIILGVLIMRFILQSLGAEDYGIYMVVAGAIAMFSVLSGSMSSAAMRFMANSLGKTDIEVAKKTFNTTISIHLALGLLLVLFLELGGWLMFEWILNIPDTKIADAKIVYQFMVVTAFIEVLIVPFDAIINAHENLLFLGITNIIWQILKLLIAIFLLFSEGNKLIEYGLLMAVSTLAIMLIRFLYCRFKYEESKVLIRASFDKSLAKSMFSFTGWEMLASLSALAVTQLRGILINMFFGVRLNAGEGIAKSVNAYANNVSIGITNAITPQMNKSEGAGDRARLIRLTNVGVKFTTFMFALVALPILLEIPFILKVWLTEVPDFAPIFCQLCITLQLISKLTWQIGNAIRAVGDIKFYRIFGASMSFISIVVAYLLLKMGGGPTTIFYVEIVISIITGGITLIFGKNIVGIQPWKFIRETTLPVLVPFLLSLLIGIGIQYLMVDGWLRLVTVSIASMLPFSLMFWFFGIQESEKTTLRDVLNQMLTKFHLVNR